VRIFSRFDDDTLFGSAGKTALHFYWKNFSPNKMTISARSPFVALVILSTLSPNLHHGAITIIDVKRAASQSYCKQSSLIFHEPSAPNEGELCVLKVVA